MRASSRVGAALDPAGPIRFCEARLAYFATPRYVDRVAAGVDLVRRPA